MRIFIIFCILLTSIKLCFSQSIDSDSISCKSIELDNGSFSNQSIAGISKLVYAFMQDYQDVPDIKMSEDEKDGMRDFHRLFLTNKGSKTRLASIDSFLIDEKNGWSDNLAKVFKTLKAKYDNQLKEQNYSLDELFKTKVNLVIPGKLNERLHWDSTLKQILSEGNQGLEVKKPIEPKSINVGNERASRRELPLFQNGLILIFLSSLISFCLGMIAFFLYTKRKIYRILNTEMGEYKKAIQASSYSYSYFGIIEHLKSRKNLHKEEVKKAMKNESDSTKGYFDENSKLKGDISDLESKIKEIDRQLQNTKELTGENFLKSDAFTEPVEKRESPQKNETLYVEYYSMPQEDGSFLRAHAKKSAESRSYYKIITKGDDEGVLVYISGVLDVSAISQMNDILEPVCDIDNLIDTSSKGLKVLSDGRVTKSGDKWILSEKIKIKLI
jgi:hypothetical protein